MGGRTIHPNFAIAVDGHEPKGRVRIIIENFNVEPVPLGDRPPIAEARSAQRVGAKIQSGRPDDIHINDISQIADIGADIIIFMDGWRLPGFFVCHPSNFAIAVA